MQNFELIVIQVIFDKCHAIMFTDHKLRSLKINTRSIFITPPTVSEQKNVVSEVDINKIRYESS